MVKIKENIRSLLLGVALFFAGLVSLSILVIMIFFIKNSFVVSPEKTEQPMVIIESPTKPKPTQSKTPDTQTPYTAIPASPTIIPTLTMTPVRTFTPLVAPTPTSDPRIEEILASMTVEEKVGQMLLMGIDGQSITQTTCNLIKRLSPGGIIYRGSNANNPKQLSQLSDALQECSSTNGGLPLFIAIDHEGQYVTRFNSGVTIFPSAMAQGATAKPQYAYQAALAAGKELGFSGVNMVLGPVADVLTNYDNIVISQRSFGGDPELVSHFVSKAVQGYLDAGIIPVLKHFPGHGGVAGDTHYSLVEDEVSKDRLIETYLPPFTSGLDAGAPTIMFSHVTYSSIDDSALPASLSPAMINLLRDDLDFDGITMTDSIGMGAISGNTHNISEAAIKAIIAGEDILLVTSPSTAQAAYNSIVQAIHDGTINERDINAAVRRILNLKAAQGLLSFPTATPSPPDWNANDNLSFDIGEHAVSIQHNELGLIPLPKNARNLLIIGPTDGWGLYNILGTVLHNKGYSYQVVTYSNPWSGPIQETNYLNSLPNKAKNYDLVIFLTWDSHLNQFRFNDTWQIKMANRLINKKDALIIVALKSPTDIIDFPQARTYITTFGTTQGQLQGLADILVGDFKPKGINPLPNLP
jgi:beta-N-acetylhexosaminidase